MQFHDLASCLDLRRHEAGILEHAVSDSQIGSNQRIVIELERPTGAGQVIELAGTYGLIDPRFGECFKNMHRER